MKLRDAVDRVTADAREMRHAHVARAGLIDERESRQPGVVRREFFAYFIEKTAINLVHDFEMPREQ